MNDYLGMDIESDFKEGDSHILESKSYPFWKPLL